MGENALAAWRGRTIGVVFQFFQLLPTLTALENVMPPMDFCATPAFHARRARALELLALMEIEGHAHKLPARLSGGQQQRVAIARNILVSPGLLANEPTLRLGGLITVNIEGREQTYTIVGVMNMMGNSTIGYFTVMDYAAYARHVREPNRANAVILTLDPGSLEQQRAIASAVEARYDRANLRVISNFLIADERQEIDGAFGIVVALLMVMTLVLAAVGGPGLMGTMSLNVIERTREIGGMRAYGASSTAVVRIVILEGLLIGMLSWILAIGLSLPLSVLLAHTIGAAFLDDLDRKTKSLAETHAG